MIRRELAKGTPVFVASPGQPVARIVGIADDAEARPAWKADNGQRYEVRFSDGTGEHTLSYAATAEGASRIVEAYQRNPQGWPVWIVDRQAPVAKEAPPPPR